MLIYRRRVEIKNRPAYVVVAVDNTDRAKIQKEMELLARASEIFNSSLDLQEILDRVTRIMTETLCDRCGVFIQEGRGIRLHLASLSSRLDEHLKKTQGVLEDLPKEMTDKFIDSILTTGEPVLVEDAMADDNWCGHFRSLSIRS